MYKQGDVIISKQSSALTAGWNWIASMLEDTNNHSTQGVIHAMPGKDKTYVNRSAGLLLKNSYKIGKLKEKWNFGRAKN